VVTGSDGEKTLVLRKVPLEELEEWDRTYDHAGQLRISPVESLKSIVLKEEKSV
jgi:hypothetical protein